MKRKALSPIFFHLSAFGDHKTRQTGQKAATSSNKKSSLWLATGDFQLKT